MKKFLLPFLWFYLGSLIAQDSLHAVRQDILPFVYTMPLLPKTGRESLNKCFYFGDSLCHGSLASKMSDQGMHMIENARQGKTGESSEKDVLDRKLGDPRYQSRQIVPQAGAMGDVEQSFSPDSLPEIGKPTPFEEELSSELDFLGKTEKVFRDQMIHDFAAFNDKYHPKYAALREERKKVLAAECPRDKAGKLDTLHYLRVDARMDELLRDTLSRELLDIQGMSNIYKSRIFSRYDHLNQVISKLQYGDASTIRSTYDHVIQGQGMILDILELYLAIIRQSWQMACEMERSLYENNYH